MTAPVGVDDHRAAVAAVVGSGRVQNLPVQHCAGRVLAADVRAAVGLPPFDNSAMDGYAVRAADIATAGPDSPVTLPVATDIPAGRIDVPALAAGTAARIMTGAALPDGADAVVRVEDTDGGVDTVRICSATAAGSHIRLAGEDIGRAELALRAGDVLTPARIGLAAATGAGMLPVYAPLHVLVVSTGSELIRAPEPLAHGQIYESNSLMLHAAIADLGCRVSVLRSVADDVATFRAAIAEHDGVDLVVTSGGVSAGAYEVVKDALRDAGVTFRGVAMQPGGPQGCGTVDGVGYVTLPGNPVSVLVSFEVFLRPALLAALGHRDVHRPVRRARVRESLSSPAGKRQFRRGCFTAGTDGTAASVDVCGGPGSHLLAAMSAANCLIVLDEDTTEVAAGDEVDVLLLPEPKSVPIP